MWRESLTLWKLSLVHNPLPVTVVLLLLVFLNLLTFLPPFSLMAVLFNYYILFAYVVFASKKFLECGGDTVCFERSIRVNPFKALFSYLPETIAVLIAQFLLTLLAFVFALVVFSVGGVWSVLKPLLGGGEVSWTGLLVSVLLALFVYFSVVTSFPMFFGRAMLRGKGFSGTLRSFITSLYAEISWRTMLSWEYIKSSFVISLIALGFFLAHLLVAVLPPLIVVAPVLTFVTLHLLYLFGTVSVFRLLRS